jgi:hypothetical protein
MVGKNNHLHEVTKGKEVYFTGREINRQISRRPLILWDAGY